MPLSFRLLVAIGFIAACGGDDSPGLDDYLPEIPPPTGEAQSVYAGVVDSSNADAELMPGSAASGLVGDLYIRNARARFVIQGPERVIGVIPQGGNLVDAQPIGPDGPIGEDHFGELSAMYILGRTCEHEQVDVVQDGSGGGAAAIVARGRSGVNDFINLKGIGLLNVPADLDPDLPDEIECATTYILHPDSPTIEVYWTFYNAGDQHVRGPFGALSNTGGDVVSWSHQRGFERLGIDVLTDPDLPPAPVEYALFQGPGVAYGLVPLHPEEGPPNTSLLIQGVSIILYGADEIFDIITDDGAFFDLPGAQGVTHAMRFVAGQDAADVEEQVRLIKGQETHEVSGRVTWSSGGPVAGARVGLFRDEDGDGAVGDDEPIWTYADTDADGRFSARLAPGDYLARADVFRQGRSAVAEVALTADRTVDLQVAAPVQYDYAVVDDETGELIPARLLVVGQSPVPTDSRLFSTYDSVGLVADVVLATRGTSVDVGDGADRRISLVPGTDYRVYAVRGTEWSVASQGLSPVAGDPDGDLEFRLRRVIDTSGYISSEYHVHSIGSPDSPVDWPDRIATAVADGVELFAVTEHDYVADLQPIVEAMGLERLLRVLPGLETTPFAYGHFNAWPIEPDGSANGGAVDWARGASGFALLPREIYDEMRDKGAELIQVNHPRVTPGSLADFMEHFDRAGLSFDYENRVIAGDLLGQPVSNEWLRLPPEMSMWDLTFNALEVWNSMAMSDSDGDGRREPQGLDVVLRDWFNFLSFGVALTPLGNSDTHTIESDPMGMPRTLVRVEDDSPAALASGAVVASLLDTLAGRGPTPHDMVITNGPHIGVTVQGQTTSAIGRVVDGSAAGEVTLTISVQAPTWAEFDTLEVFANAIPEVGARVTSLQPVACFTRVPQAELDPADPCASAPLGATVLAVDRVEVAPGFERYEATVDITLSSDQPIYPDGGSGQDAWVVVRARGDRGIFPALPRGISSGNLAALLGGVEEDVDEAMRGTGVPATAFTAPVYLDLDGGGYQAVFGPE